MHSLRGIYFFILLLLGFTKWFLKKSFFGHFCAGETAEELLPVVDKLRNNGIGSILDYAAESDIPQAKPQQQQPQQHSTPPQAAAG